MLDWISSTGERTSQEDERKARLAAVSNRHVALSATMEILTDGATHATVALYKRLARENSTDRCGWILEHPS